MVTPPSAEPWQRFESGLDLDDSPATFSRLAALPGSEISLNTRRWLLLAVTVVVAVTVGMFGYRSMFPSHEHDQFTVVFDEYLQRFKSDPHDAQSFLLSKYENQFVQPEEAVDHIGYRPIVADGLPDRYSIVSIDVMKMPCCTCVQCLCQRADGIILAIFEHDDEEPEWFGTRPTANVTCQAKQCALMEIPGSIKASWKSEERHVTTLAADCMLPDGAHI